MKIDELRAKIKEGREKYEANKGKAQMTGPSGPIGINWIEHIADVLEAQQKQIDELTQRLDQIKGV